MTDKKNSSDSASRFPTATDLLAFFGIFLLGQAVGGAVWALWRGMPDAELLAATDAASQRTVALFNFVQYGVAMAVTTAGLLLYRSRRHAPKAPVQLSIRGCNPLTVLWGASMMAALVVVIEPLLAVMPEVPDSAYGRGVWTLVTVAVLAPLFEELVFRGILLESLRVRYGTVAALTASSLLFGLVHLHPTVAVNAIFMGLILGFVYIATGSLWASVALHALNNTLSYILLSAGHGDLLFSEIIADKGLHACIYGLSVAVLAASAYGIAGTLRRLARGDKNGEIDTIG